jgi:hypothetical protein
LVREQVSGVWPSFAAVDKRIALRLTGSGSVSVHVGGLCARGTLVALVQIAIPIERHGPHGLFDDDIAGDDTVMIYRFVRSSSGS